MARIKTERERERGNQLSKRASRKEIEKVKEEKPG